VEVRAATAADVEVLRRLWADSTAETAFAPYRGPPFDPALIEDHLALVAEEDGRIVGTAYANVVGPAYGFVFGVYVRPEARRRGIAHTLMRAIAIELRNRGRAYVVLSVDTPNAGARAFYERLGFVDAARILRAHVDQLAGG
jgi:ribosomal protein S18 acetylase RimI-like enzyme